MQNKKKTRSDIKMETLTVANIVINEFISLCQFILLQYYFLFNFPETCLII